MARKKRNNYQSPTEILPAARGEAEAGPTGRVLNKRQILIVASGKRKYIFQGLTKILTAARGEAEAGPTGRELDLRDRSAPARARILRGRISRHWQKLILVRPQANIG